MKTLLLTAIAGLTLTVTALTASAQNAVLADLYGRGVHAYYANDLDQAYELLTMAIDNDIQDPRAYYFRGIVHHVSGRMEEAKSDWQDGAELEAQGQVNASIGRSLSRFQGSARLELEQIRQRAKLEAMAEAMKRSNQRYGEIGAEPGGNAAAAPQPQPAQPAPAQPAPTPPTAATQPAPAAGGNAADNPFADDMADGEPQVAADDALEGAMENPFAGEADDAAAPAAPAGNNNPFGGGGDDAGNPFGGGNDGGNPFGGGADDGGAGNPFGGGTGGMPGAGEDNNPFGGGGGGGGDANPFGDNPF